MTHQDIFDLFMHGDLVHANDATHVANYQSISQTAFFPLFQDDFTDTVLLLFRAVNEIQRINCMALDQLRRGGALT